MLGRDYDKEGRIDIELLKATLPFGDYDFYLCGPPGFVDAVRRRLHRIGVPADQIHAERFEL